MPQEVQYTLSLKDLLTAKIKGADQAVARFEGTITKAKSAAMSFGSAVGIAFGSAAVVAFGSKMMQAGTKVEDTLIGLTTSLKDAAMAQQVINKTMEDATKTPFSFETLMDANRALISSGVNADRARTDVLNLANAIAASGKGNVELERMVYNLQQIKNNGEATAVDIKQFGIAGVNIYQVLADYTGKSVEKVKDMNISYDALTAALGKAAGAGGLFENALANMAEKSTSVKISNIGDDVFKLSVTMFNDLKPAIDSTVKGISNFIAVLTQGWNWLVKNKEIVSAVAIGVLAGAAAWGTYLIVVNATNIATAILTAAQWALNTAMSANPVGILVVAFGALVAGVIYAWRAFGQFRAVLQGVWGVIKEFASIVVDIFQGVWKVIHGVFTFSASEITAGWDQAANAMMDAGKRMATGFRTGYDEGMKDFADQQAKNATVAAPKTVVQAGAGTKSKGLVGETAKSETKGAQGQKAVTINVTIGNLIKDFKISTTNIQESASKVREMVAQALVSATNDSQLIAGQ